MTDVLKMAAILRTVAVFMMMTSGSLCVIGVIVDRPWIVVANGILFGCNLAIYVVNKVLANRWAAGHR